MLRPVLEIAAEVVRHAGRPLVMIAGVQGDVQQAVAEARLAADLGYHLVLLRPGAGDDDAMITRARAVGEVLPVVGFYLRPAVGGRGHQTPDGARSEGRGRLAAPPRRAAADAGAGVL